jgi:hypothetical protein
MFAYPGGGNRGASGATSVLVLIAVIVLWRRGERTILALLMMPMGVALSAAFLRLYPYGGEARIMQYVAPAICLMAGLGLSTLLARFPRPTGRGRATGLAAIVLGVAGIALQLDDFRHPYRTKYDQQVREFARRFWPEQARDAEVACLNWDFGINRRHVAYSRTAIYLCNQQIYSPQRRPAGGLRIPRVTTGRPLRCVAYDIPLKSPEATAWLASMEKQYVLQGRKDIVVPTIGLDMQPWEDHLMVFEFQPKPMRPMERTAIEPANRTLSR